MRTCTKCGKKKRLTEFELVNKEKGYRRGACRECRKRYFQEWSRRSRAHLREYALQYYRKHRDRELERAARWQRQHPQQRRKIALTYYYRLQFEAIEAYGGFRCACCGESEPLFLTIDHVRNDGREHRKQLGSLGGAKFYKDLRDRNWPKGFQVLCMNCNQGRYRNGGTCPHKEGVTTIPKGSSPKVRAKRTAPGPRPG